MTTATVASGQESGGAITLDSGAPGLILYQNSVVRPTFIKDDVCLPPLSGSEVEGAFPSGSRTATPTLVSDLTIYVLLAVLAVVFALALVVVPDSSLMLDDPISFARGG